MVTGFPLASAMKIPFQRFSNHILPDGREINVSTLISTLNSLGMVRLVERYDISRTTYTNTNFKTCVMKFMETIIPDIPVVITSNNHCIDGRHRIQSNLNVRNYHIPAYIIPHEMICKFIS
jgi:hypothetical protein